MKKYAFVDDAGVVVNCINGILTEAQQQQFLRDYKLLFGAAIVVEVEDSLAVHPGGTYANGEFFPAPQPETTQPELNEADTIES